MIESPSRRTVLIVLAALMALHVVVYAFAEVLLDSSRDLSQAWAIVEGAHPLLGPGIDNRFHLGPSWFYLLAVPLALTRSATAALLWVGLLSALKFPLAYVCGKRLLDARFGLLWALALAAPGWNSLQAMFPTHTNLVETMMLAAFLPLIRLWRGGAAYGWCIFGLLFGLALHAHPTVVAMLPLVFAVAWRRREAWRGDIVAVAAGVALAVLPFVPMLVHETTHGWPMFDTLFKGTSSNASVALAGAGRFIAGVQMHGALAALAPLGTGVGVVALAAWFACMPALACMAVFHPSWRARREAWAIPFAAVFAWLLLSAVRERTPFYMVYAWLPFAACLTAYGCWLLWRLQRGRRLALAMMGSIAAGALLVAAVRVQDAHDGLVWLPGNVSDVRRSAPPHAMPLLPVFLLDHWGREVCAQPRHIVLHGDLALLVDAGLALPVRMVCDGAERVHIGGGAALADAWHVVGLTPGQRRILGDAGARWSQTFTESPLRVVAASGTTPVANGGLLSLRTRRESGLQERELQFEAPRAAIVQIGLPFVPYDEARVERAEADGVGREPLLTGAASQLYRCDGCAGDTVRWRVVLRTREPERLDVVLLNPVAAASRD
jgi:hypothetical protein